MRHSPQIDHAHPYTLKTKAMERPVLRFIQSFDEVNMTIFPATPGTRTLLVVRNPRIALLADTLTIPVSTIMIVGAMLLMSALNWMAGIDRVLPGQK